MATHATLQKNSTPKQIVHQRDVRPRTARLRILPVNGNGTSTYQPISSVWERGDGELLEAMFKFYATIPPEPILDATYNAGRFWKGSKRRVTSMDNDPQYKPMIVGDNREMAF